jgi:cytochrome c551/c552
MGLENVLKNSCIKLSLMCGFVLGLSGCGDQQEQPRPNAATPPSQSTVGQTVAVATSQAPGGAMSPDSGNSTEVGMPAAAKRNNCTACHSINKKIVGPAWMTVSIKYKGADKFEYNGKEYPLVEGLMMKVSQGGSGHWGSMPMPANDYKGIKQADIKELVQFVLSLSK